MSLGYFCFGIEIRKCFLYFTNKKGIDMVSEELLKDALAYGKAFIKNGQTAQYIPELKNVNKYYLGICVITQDGKILKKEM